MPRPGSLSLTLIHQTTSPVARGSACFPCLALCAAVLFACALLFLPFARGDEPARKQYDIPAVAAEMSLKSFSRQSGVELVFPTKAVAGVRTNAVRGSMTAEEALAKMLAGTELFVIRDSKTGALTINRKTLPPASQNAEPSKKKAI